MLGSSPAETVSEPSSAPGAKKTANTPHLCWHCRSTRVVDVAMHVSWMHVRGSCGQWRGTLVHGPRSDVGCGRSMQVSTPCSRTTRSHSSTTRNRRLYAGGCTHPSPTRHAQGASSRASESILCLVLIYEHSCTRRKPDTYCPKGPDDPLRSSSSNGNAEESQLPGSKASISAPLERKCGDAHIRPRTYVQRRRPHPLCRHRHLPISSDCLDLFSTPVSPMNAPGCLATAPAAVCAPRSLSLARALSLSSSRMLPPPTTTGPTSCGDRSGAASCAEL